MSNAASEAAAGLAPELAAELVARVPDAGGNEDVLATEVHAAAAEQTVPSSQQTVAPDAVQETDDDEFVLPSFEYVTVEDDDEDLIPTDTVEETDDDEQLVEGYEDEDSLRARLSKLEKQNRYLAEQAASAKRDEWKKRYKDKYPLANIDTIAATSRRAFERAAIQSHNDNYRLLEPHIARLQEAREKILGATQAEARADAAAAYGRPTAGPGVTPLTQSAQTEELVAARKRGDLTKVVGALLRGSGVNVK